MSKRAPDGLTSHAAKFASLFGRRALRALLACSAFVLAGATHAQTAPAPALSTEQIEAVVKAYLLKNPVVIRDAIIQLQRQEAAEAAARAKLAVTTLRKELLDSPVSPSVGNPKADVTIVEFFDFHCGYCKRASPVLQEVLATDPNVRIVYKQLPILGPDSLFAARVALAANLQGKYKELHEALFESESLDEKSVFAAAAKLGLNVNRLRLDMNSTAISSEIELNNQLIVPLGITGTPGFVIGNNIAPGMLDLNGMRQMIAEARSTKQ